MRNHPKDNICLFTTFLFRKTSLKFNWTEIVLNAMLMWLNRNVATINVTLKILDITSLRSYIYKINLDLEYVLSTQTYIFPLCKCKKMDRSG